MNVYPTFISRFLFPQKTYTGLNNLLFFPQKNVYPTFIWRLFSPTKLRYWIFTIRNLIFLEDKNYFSKVPFPKSLKSGCSTRLSLNKKLLFWAFQTEMFHSCTIQYCFFFSPKRPKVKKVVAVVGEVWTKKLLFLSTSNRNVSFT